MKIVFIILAVVAGIVALPFIIALFINNDYKVEREIIINKPKQEVFEYVKYQKNQGEYNKWMMQDPNAKVEHRGTDGTVGYVMAWSSEVKGLGKGEQEIVNIDEGQHINLEIRFKEPFENVGLTTMTTEAVTDSEGREATKVKWGMAGRNKYPMNFMNLFMGGMLAKDLDVSLGNLKSVLEGDKEAQVVEGL